MQLQVRMRNQTDNRNVARLVRAMYLAIYLVFSCCDLHLIVYCLFFPYVRTTVHNNISRHYAEHSGYFEKKLSFVKECRDCGEGDTIQFYDSNTGKLLFTAPQGRTMDEFLIESRSHGWPSFRDAEVHWENVRCLKDGETVSVDGTHLGHNLPDRGGSRYCINLVCVAGNPIGELEI
jgi:hypothetical protein